MLKVLIYGVSLTGDKSATGTSMENMLLGMPEVEWMQYCHDSKKEDHAILFNTIFLDKKCWFFDYYIRKLFVKKHSDSTASGYSMHTKRFRPDVLVKGILGFMPFNKRKIDLAAVKKMEPDIIYTMAATEQIMRTVLYLSCQLHIPIVFHCMDDWRKTIYADYGIYRVFYRHLNHLIKLINNRSVMNIGICEKMAEQYQRDYAKPYSFAGNCIAECSFNFDEYSPNENGTLTVIYAGGLHLNRWASLLRAANAVEKANHDGLKITLEIYVSQSDFEHFNKKFNFAHTIFTTYVSPEKQKGNLLRADLLLHTESFDAMDVKYTLLSFTTKLAEYMAAGRAILGFGDKRLASIDYISANKCGWTAETDEELVHALHEAVKDPELRKKYAVNAFNTAQNFHTKAQVQQRIYSVLKYTAENRKNK